MSAFTAAQQRRRFNDNPYSEAQFKTLKYRPEFPGRFGSIDDARAFCPGFFRWSGCTVRLLHSLHLAAYPGAIARCRIDASTRVAPAMLFAVVSVPGSSWDAPSR
jgi:hypothetical protein